MNSTLDLAKGPAQRFPLLPTLLLVAAFVAPILLYFDTARSIVAIWYRSETFAHGFVILPICIWLVWRRRENFIAMPPTPWPPALGLLALAGLLWLIAGVADVQVVQQYALALMIPITALAVLGPRLAMSLAFPLLFVLAAVPFGEIFIAPLISFTADFTVWCLHLIGMPVLRNGTVFEIPSGNWSVVEACSGVRYLISSVTIGCLYAYLTYESTLRRVVFVIMAVLVPIVANGLRAFMIVMIGHLSGMKLAVGFDHLIYGWVFFGLVMFLMFWVGNFWREDPPLDAATAAVTRAPLQLPRPARLVRIAAALLLVGGVWPALMAYQQSASHNPRPVQLAPVAVTWPLTTPLLEWEPDYVRPDARSTATYRSADGAGSVALHLLYYRNQNRNKSLISSGNHLAPGGNGIHEVATDVRSETIGAVQLPVREGRLSTPQGNMLVWQWHWVDGAPTVSNVAAKIMQARAKLSGRSDDGAAVMLMARYDDNPERARTALRDFLQANFAQINASLNTTREH